MIDVLISPKAEYERWMTEFGGNTSREAVNRIARQMRKDSKGRSDGKGRFRGSLLGDPCDRKQVLSFLGASQNYADLKYAMSGTWSHSRWQACGLTMGWLLEIEVPVKVGRMRGSADGFMADGRILEVKTTRSTVLKSLKAPKEQALMQVNFYMYATGTKQACIVYEGREDLSIKEFDVEYDEDLMNTMLDRVDTLHAKAKTGTLPLMHPGCYAGSTMRDFCGFSTTCLSRWAEEDDQ